MTISIVRLVLNPVIFGLQRKHSAIHVVKIMSAHVRSIILDGIYLFCITFIGHTTAAFSRGVVRYNTPTLQNC